MAAKKLDLYAMHRAEYLAKREPAIVNVGPARYLAIEGRGAPEDASFEAAVGALYAVAFTVKMARKLADTDYKVTALEGLWWTGGKGHHFLHTPRTSWRWQLLIRTPDFVTKREVARAIAALLERGKPKLVASVELIGTREGRCVQALHVGPYATEPETIARMLEVAAAAGYKAHGTHHEIYLSDPRRAKPEKLKTILRAPLRKR
jgi:hypothetical protein